MRVRVLRLKWLAMGLMAVGVLFAGSWLVMSLWNWVVPALFVGVRAIDYPHALGLLVLTRILFGGLRGHGGWHARRHWRRWEAMSPEERENFQQLMQSRRGGCQTP